MRIGLVLGAGGLVGASWLIGALEALESETGWSPSQADVIVGTSAGSVIGALVAAGVPPAHLNAYSSGRALDALAEMETRGERLAGRVADALDDATETVLREAAGAFRLQRALPPLGPGSWRMALGTLISPTRHSPAALLGGWLPRGFISTRPISELVEALVPGDWPEHPACWTVAADYSTGRRVVFGREGAPAARIGDAVAASCAIPAFYHPVRIGGRRYVDGGLCSPTNLDIVRDRELDLVVCLSPMSSREGVAVRSPGDAFGAVMRAQAGRRLGHEARKLRESGTEVLLLQPGRRDVEAMGLNLMSRGRRAAVAETALRSTALALRELRGSDVRLPGRARARRRAPATASRRRAA